MIVVRFKVQCQPDATAAVADAMREVVMASGRLDGVVAFDIGTDITNANSLIATEVFEDAAARQRQESLPEVAAVMALLPTSLAGPPEMSEMSVEVVGSPA